jgi:hypothetical protein
MTDFEQLGVFYLGREYDLAAGRAKPDLLLYDSTDLTTHAVCVGMTGSGKTGLCLALLEEAAIDGVPAIAIDPKGDLGNLLLAFPELRPEDFRPWIDQSAAARKGQSPDEFAASTADLWRKGLADWGQDGERIRRFREAVDVAIYTPGSTAGLPITVLRSFAVPPREVREDSEAFGEQVSSTTSGVLALLGNDADPLTSREHILLANILMHAWQQGRSLDIPLLIQLVQAPPFDRVGMIELEHFFPAGDRLALAMRINSLLASPGFASWLEGEPLDVKRLLYTSEGRPRISILSIAHLSDSERMFFVTILLGEVLAWMRRQPGTSSLRALLYMDEVFGFFPPTANPPAKRPMLTLLKQARAYGLGCLLATQNPVDLDYKGLSNAGTWFIGRLQTERDKLRVMEGLEGASAAAGAAFDRQAMEATLAGLSSRVFLMNNVHEDAPVVFQSRWALSYLSGPLTRSQIETLMAPREAASSEEAVKPPPSTALPSFDEPIGTSARPPVPPEVTELFAACKVPLQPGDRLVYRPGLFGTARLHFVRASYGVDMWKTMTAIDAVHKGELPEPLWDAALVFADPPEMAEGPDSAAAYATLPSELQRVGSYKSIEKKLVDYLYRTQAVSVRKCTSPKLYSHPDEPEDDFRIRIMQAAREQRDQAVEKLRSAHAARLAAVREQVRKAQERVDRENAQYRQRQVDTAVSFGQSLLGALLGRKLASRTNVSRASTAARSVTRAARERGDVGRAEDALATAQAKLADEEKSFAAEIESLQQSYAPEALEIEELAVKPRKSDVAVEQLALIWLPWRIDDRQTAHVAW